MTTEVKLVSITPDAEATMGYIARVSNPANQNNPNVAGLLSYCLRHGHWSVFEQATMTMEIKTTRAISAQILRHRSFTFQEFSQRYAEVNSESLEVPELRAQDTTNRQNSFVVEEEEQKAIFEGLQKEAEILFDEILDLYQEMLNFGVAKECARMILPMCSPTTIYMTGNVRSWINYINLRAANGTQKEHMEVAEMAKQVFVEQLPVVAKALGWVSETE